MTHLTTVVFLYQKTSPYDWPKHVGRDIINKSIKCNDKTGQLQQLKRSSFESKHNYLMLLCLFKLTTCFGPRTGPSSRHTIYN